jgi:hypothetical protein
MGRYVAHRIFADGTSEMRNGFVEIQEDGTLSSIRPLHQGEEPQNTILVNGILVPPYGKRLTAGETVPVIAIENLEWNNGRPVLTAESTFRVLP